MNFFRTIKESIYSPSFYKESLKKSFSTAFLYFLFFSILISLVNVVFIIPELWKLQNQIPGFVTSVVDQYPKELQIKIKNGKATTNVKEPYFIKMPGNNEEVQNLFVIDTKASVSAEQLVNTIQLLGSQKMLYFINQEENQS